MMKRYLILVLLLSFISSSCKKKPKDLLFTLNMQLPSAAFTLPPTTDTIDTLPYGSIYFTYNVDSFIRANTAHQLGINSITGVTLASCILTIQDPDTVNNFRDFSTCDATFASDANPAPYMVLMNNADTFAASVTAEADTVTQLKSYLATDHFRYSFGGKLRRTITKTLNCTVQFAFIVNVGG